MNLLKKFICHMGLVSSNNLICIWGMSNDYNKYSFNNINSGKYSVKITYTIPHLNVNIYYLNIAIRNSITVETYTKLYTDYNINIVSNRYKIERSIVYSKEYVEIKKCQ